MTQHLSEIKARVEAIPQSTINDANPLPGLNIRIRIEQPPNMDAWVVVAEFGGKRASHGISGLAMHNTRDPFDLVAKAIASARRMLATLIMESIE